MSTEFGKTDRSPERVRELPPEYRTDAAEYVLQLYLFRLRQLGREHISPTGIKFDITQYDSSRKGVRELLLKYPHWAEEIPQTEEFVQFRDNFNDPRLGNVEEFIKREVQLNWPKGDTLPDGYMNTLNYVNLRENVLGGTTTGKLSDIKLKITQEIEIENLGTYLNELNQLNELRQQIVCYVEGLKSIADTINQNSLEPLEKLIKQLPEDLTLMANSINEIIQQSRGINISQHLEVLADIPQIRQSMFTVINGIKSGKLEIKKGLPLLGNILNVFANLSELISLLQSYC